MIISDFILTHFGEERLIFTIINTTHNEYVRFPLISVKLAICEIISLLFHHSWKRQTSQATPESNLKPFISKHIRTFLSVNKPGRYKQTEHCKN